MNDKPEIKPQGISPLKRMCITIGELPTSYLESMTYYEMLLWFTKFLQEKMIPALDNNALAVEELQKLFVELQSYVNNYFDNLDVQDEINNKLDDMLEDGVLEQIIEQFLQSTALWCFNTVEDMKNATNLINGSYAKTIGYYEANDGGGATYKITNTESETDYQEELENDLYANLIVTNNINISQFGAKGDNETDNTLIIQKALNLTKNKILYFDSGEFLISDTLNLENNTLIGKNTIIKTTSKVDNYSNKMLNPIGTLKIKGIKFDANNIDYTIIPDTQLTSIDIDNCEFTGVKQNTRQDNLSLNSAINTFAKYIKITNSSIHDNMSHGLMIGTSIQNSNLYINNCKFNYNGVGIVSLGLGNYNEETGSKFEKAIIKDCEAIGNGASGIAPHTIYNVIVDSCISNNNGEHGFCLMDGKNGSIINCIAQNNAAYGIRVQGDYSGVQNPHYDNFKLLNNIIEGRYGISCSYNMNGGLIKNNHIESSDNQGINLVRNKNVEFSGYYKNVIIEDNDIIIEKNYNSITSFIQIEDTNIIQNNIINGEIKDGYYINTIWYGTPNKLKYGTTNNIIDYPTDFSQWTQGGFSRDGNTFTINGAENTVCRKITNITANTRFITVFLDFGNSNVSSLDLLGLLIRFRNSQGTLLNYERGPLSSNQYGVIRKNFAKKSAILVDLKEFDFDNQVVSQVEVFIKAKSTEQEIPLTINGVYMALSSELPILPNEM